MHDDFEPISAIVERLVKSLAPDPGEETEPGAHHDNREGETGVVIFVNFGCRPHRGATGPAGSLLHPGGEAQQAPGFRMSPATGGHGNRRYWRKM